MTDHDLSRRLAARARQPWQDELARLRWLESRVIALVGGWQSDARELRDMRDVTPADLDPAGRAQLEARAVELDGAAESLAALVTDSHAGEPTATDLDWAQWHVAELARHLAVAAVAAGAVIDGDRGALAEAVEESNRRWDSGRHQEGGGG